MTFNRIWPREPPPYDDDSKSMPVSYAHTPGPLMEPYQQAIITQDGIQLTSIGGQTKLEAAAVDVAVALIHAEAVTLGDLLKDPALQVGLGKAAVKIASSVLETTAAIQTRAGDQGK